MKKAIILTLVLILMLSLTACGDAGTYKKAQSALEQGEYKQTIALLDSIPNYDDTDKLRQQANAGVLTNIVEEAGGTEFCNIGSDGSFIKLDTNPSDIKDYYNPAYIQAVKDINIALGFSASLWEKMGQTRAMDGRLTDENEEFTVSWTYHPSSGMSALYERKSSTSGSK